MIEFILERLILQACVVVGPGGIKAVSVRIEVSAEMPDAAGLKMPAAAEILGAAGVSYRIEELRPHAVRRTESEKEGEMRVVRQRETADHTLILSICSIYE